MRKFLFIILNIALILLAGALGLLGVIETGIDAGCYFYGDKTIFCFTPSLVLLSLAALLGGASIFMIWRRQGK